MREVRKTASVSRLIRQKHYLMAWFILIRVPLWIEWNQKKVVILKWFRECIGCHYQMCERILYQRLCLTYLKGRNFRGKNVITVNNRNMGTQGTNFCEWLSQKYFCGHIFQIELSNVISQDWFSLMTLKLAIFAKIFTCENFYRQSMLSPNLLSFFYVENLF